jgi:hypothetical protein
LNASNINFFTEGESRSALLMTCDKVAVVVLETASEMQKLGAETGSELSRGFPLPTSDSVLNDGKINQPHMQPWQ